ncbi:MAG: CoA transferase [Betaproteobacteria bacterium]
MSESSWAGPLAGVTVLDFTRVVAGPYASLLLADLGAEILKIEPPPGGDDIRSLAPHVGGESHYYLAFNRNKKSLVIDLKQPAGVALALDLARRADVVLENFRPGVMHKLGLGYETLSAANPGLVYCAISGFGASGPMRDRPSFDLITQAMSGVMSVNGPPDAPPQKLGLPLGDLAGGMYGALAVVSALFERKHSGRGRLIDISLMDCMQGMLGYLAQLYFVTGREPGRSGNKHPLLVPYGDYATADGRILIVCLTDASWQNVARALEHPEWIDDVRYASIASRVQHRVELDRDIESVLAGRPTADWQHRLDQADVPNAPILGVGASLEHPQTRARQMVEEVQHPTAGTVRLVGRPIKFAGESMAPMVPPPTLGQHTREVLARHLGYSAGELDALARARVIDTHQARDRSA